MEVCSRTSITTVCHAFLSTAAPRSRRASGSWLKPFRLVGADVSIIPIQVTLRHVALDGWRHPSGHGFARGKRVPELGGRYVRRLDKAFDDALGIETGGGKLGRLWSLGAWATHDHDRRQRPHPIRLVPGVEQARRIPTQDQE